jgi:hypothetical protein
MEVAERYRSVASRLALAKNSRTPGLAFVLLTTEVAVLANVRNRRDYVGQVPPARPVQGGLQNLPVFLLGAESNAVTNNLRVLALLSAVPADLTDHCPGGLRASSAGAWVAEGPH